MNEWIQLCITYKTHYNHEWQKTEQNKKKQRKKRALFSSKYEIAYCSTKECNKVYFMTAFVDTLIMPNLLQKHSASYSTFWKWKKKSSGYCLRRGSMNRLFIHQMHPQVNRDIISEMSLPTHPPFQLHHLADATGGLKRSQNISAISSFPQAVSVHICHRSALLSVILTIMTSLQQMWKHLCGFFFFFANKRKVHMPMFRYLSWLPHIWWIDFQTTV